MILTPRGQPRYPQMRQIVFGVAEEGSDERWRDEPTGAMSRQAR
jgi:hypothetical protein